MWLVALYVCVVSLGRVQHMLSLLCAVNGGSFG